MCGKGSGIQIDVLSGNLSEISGIYVIRQNINNIQFYFINGSIPSHIFCHESAWLRTSQLIPK